MILTVEHVTRYRYDTPVRGLVQSHRLTPASTEGQRVSHWHVAVSDGISGGGFRDGAGDRIESWSVRGPVEEVEIRVTGEVVTTDQAGVLRGHRETIAPQCYLRDTTLTHPGGAIPTLAREALGREPLAAAHHLASAVGERIVWTPGATQSQTTAAEALERGQGVCQDHTHALVALARQIGMPGRYVSGYLLADGVQEAAHAWAELYVSGLGWVGFDAANRCCPDDRYIRLGSGLDAQDAAPIRGSARGGGGEVLDVTVAVQQAQQ
ncbi:transglutaminase family protein [Falsirhodobacter sp. 20TX0035]|uniref:transglutaminase family protein n=1 Tax=Falsirhodobacter sp. 20TX0035 TaxID=3022019 RepID=UPI00232D5F16|nr:transglutaminase family protein [Falsirhodobacter sp. 20TX0035]MDB6452107.1 transglutaminase family protein [Falsirhodobacter sp. 20TX0035]